MLKMTEHGSMVNRERPLMSKEIAHVQTAGAAVKLSARRGIVVHVRWSPLTRIGLETLGGLEIARGIFSGWDPDGRKWIVFMR
jgi:hypothetical protein